MQAMAVVQMAGVELRLPVRVLDLKGRRLLLRTNRWARRDSFVRLELPGRTVYGEVRSSLIAEDGFLTAVQIDEIYAAATEVRSLQWSLAGSPGR